MNELKRPVNLSSKIPKTVKAGVFLCGGVSKKVEVDTVGHTLFNREYGLEFD